MEEQGSLANIGHQFSWWRGNPIRSNMSDDIDIYYCNGSNYRAYKINRSIIGNRELDYGGDYKYLHSGYGIYFLYSIEHTSNGTITHVYVGRAEDRANSKGMDRLREHVELDEKADRTYAQKWNKAIYITNMEINPRPEFTPGVIRALEDKFINLFKQLDIETKNCKDRIICYNKKSGEKSNELVESYKTHVYAILALLCNSGIRVIPEDKVGILVSQYSNESIQETITEYLDLSSKLKDKALREREEAIDKLSDDAVQALYEKQVREKFISTYNHFKDRGAVVINGRVYNSYQITNMQSSSTVLTREDIAKDMVSLIPSEVIKNKETKYLCLYSKDGVFFKALLDRYLEEGTNGESKEDKLRSLVRFIRDQLYIITDSIECYTLNIKKYLDTFNEYMNNLDKFWTINSENYVLPNIILIENYKTLVKTIEGRTTIKEKLEREFRNVKFDVVIGNPPYNNDLYLDFVTLGDQLAKEYTCMITPAKWQAKTDGKPKGSKKEDKNETFRKNIVPRISNIIFYRDTKDVFDIGEPGGISIILVGKVEHTVKLVKSECIRNKTLESDWEEHDEANITLLPRKILNVIGKVGQLGEGFKQSLYVRNTDHGEISIDGQLGFKRFTYTSEQDRGETLKQAGHVEVMQGDKVVGYKSIKDLFTNVNLDKWKCIQSCMPVQGSSDPFNKDTGKTLGSNLVMIIKPYQVPKGSFQILKYFESEAEANSFKSYINSKTMSFMQFFGLCGATMTKEFFRFIPDPKEWSCIYVDAPHFGVTPDKHGKYEYNGTKYCSLYKKYNLTEDEIAIIESVIKERK